MRVSHFKIDSVQSLNYKFHIMNFKRGGSYTYSPDWIEKKKAIVNPKNTVDKCFQDTLTVV